MFSVDEDMVMEVRFNLQIFWLDHQVKWMNLKENANLNVLSREEIGLLWMPKIMFENADTIKPIIIDESALISVLRMSNGEILLYANEINAEMYFNSSKNPVEYQRKYQQKFYCDFDFVWYPFDTQECGIKLKLFDSLSSNVELQAGSVKFTGEQNLLQFKVIGWNIAKSADGIIEAKLTFQRNFFNHFATTFLPSLCILLIAQCTLYFKAEHFKTSVPVTLTSMLGTFISTNFPIFFLKFSFQFCTRCMRGWPSLSQPLLTLR